MTTLAINGAEIFFSDLTLYGQVGYMDGDDANAGTSDAFRNAWFGRGVVSQAAELLTRQTAR